MSQRGRGEGKDAGTGLRPPPPGRPGASRPATPEPPPPVAWEVVETGRYRPLRTRGSFPGRELG